MRIIAYSTLRDYGTKHADCQKELETWYQIAKKMNWASPHDVKNTYANASIIANNRVVFNIRKGYYRLIVAFNYEAQIGYIKFIGTHQKYDEIDATTVSFKKPR